MPEWHKLDESQLIEQAQAGNGEAFGQLYERYAAAIFRYIFAHVDNRLDAEDLTEEVFLRAWRSISKYHQQDTPFLAYMFRIARNAVIDHHRSSRRSQRDVSLDADEYPDRQIRELHSDPGDVVSDSLERQEMRKLLNQLQEDYRTVILLRFLSGLNPDETAKVMDRSPGAVRVLQHRALTALRKLLPVEEL
jgi:RNA polymerase sigma-70 factor (ECF subfamily)